MIFIMASALTSQEEQAVKLFIADINDRRNHQNAGPLSWATAVKFMMARKFDVRRALHLYESHELTRHQECLVKFDPTNDPLKCELDTGKFTVLPTRDSSGAAIAVFTAAKHQPLETSHQVTLQGVVYQLDVALESMETQRCGIVFIYNMTGSKYANFDYELGQKILSLLKGGYPARLKKVLIVMAPLWFKAPFKILRLFVREKLRDRVYMVSLPQLLSHIPRSSLPREMGGALNLDHKAWLWYCLKCTVNRHDLCDISPLPCATPASICSSKAEDGAATANSTAPVVNGIGKLAHRNTSEESSEMHSIDEKQNSEDREKEVEVTKEAKKAEEVQQPPAVPAVVVPAPTDAEKLATSEPGDPDALQQAEGPGMSLEEFIQHLRKKSRKGLYEEYLEIKSKAPDGTFDSARLRNNQHKNRYTDVLCLDHTRVKISRVDSDPYSDYVNANFVDGYKHKNAFISTQGPLPKTFEDFWRLTWEQLVLVMVMTTRTVERSRNKCGQYWPKDDGQVTDYGPFQVTNKGMEQHKDYTVTTLLLTNSTIGESREVAHMQFTSWPDYGVPHSALAMLDFRSKVQERQSKALVSQLGSKWKGHPRGPPILVHCSAGIGRTGTFITLDVCIRRLEDCGKIDVRGTVERIRSQRAYSIQMPDQYVFCHLALLEYALSHGLLQDVDLSGFDESDSESE